MAYLVAGPFVAVIGIVAVFFVLRRKSVDKRSMYSARRSQIEHKVRAARSRTLAPHGHVDRPPEAPVAPTMPQQPAQPVVTWERTAFEAPPVAAPPTPPSRQPEAPAQMPWETPSTPAGTPGSMDWPGTSAVPSYPSTEEPAQSEAPWTPSEQPPIPVIPREPEPEPVQTSAASAAASAAAAGSWAIVSTEKDKAAPAEADGKKKKKKKGAPADTGSAWQLASGAAPGMEDEEETDVKRSNAALVATAQYVILVVGLVMVLIGVLVMVANSHVT